MNEIVRGKNIVKVYGKGTEKQCVLNGITAVIREGEFVSVMGPSGSGKSTLLFCMSGMEEIDGGSVAFCGKELSAYGERELADLRRTKMGFIFQQPAMLKNLNILENIIFPALRDNRKNAVEIIKRARALMERMGIAELEKRDITQVSGGQLQRAGICRAMMNKPMVIFGDEPTGALNSRSAGEIMDILSDINAQGTAVMLVTHDPKVAARTKRIVFLCDGNVVSEAEFPKGKRSGQEDRTNTVMEYMKRAGI